MNNFVVTIGRYCGSGGSSVGRLVAEKLGVNFYDKALLRMASEESGISEELFAQADEKIKSSLVYKVSRQIYKGELIPPESEDFTSNRNLFNYQAKVLRELAQKESYVVVGRCSDFVLKDLPGVERIFVCADNETCIRREADRTSVSFNEAESRCAKLNKYRGEYHRYYTGCEWTDPRNYDLVVNTGKLSYEEAADLIVQHMKVRGLV